MNVFELFGTIAVDNSNAERSLDRTVGHARDTESKLERTFKNIGKVIAAAFAIDKIKDFGKACTEAYASIAAEESAFAQIMGDYADTAQKKLEAVSDATGITATRMTTHMTSLTAKFKGLGYNVEDATTLATDGMLIAADAAAFWDMSLDESMSHLNSFINGSYEGGEAIGLFANDTQMAAYAVEKGIVADTKAWAALDEATKQATRIDYARTMMEQSGATGQAAKEAGSYANVVAEIKEAWRQFQGVIGKPILEKLVLPAMQKLMKIMPGLTEAVQGGIDWLLDAFDKVASYFSEVFTEDGLNMDALPAAFEKMFRDLGRAIPGLLRSVGSAIRSAWSNVLWPAIQGIFKATLGIDLPAWGDIEQKITDWWDGGNGIKKEIANVCNWALNMFGAPADVTAEDVSRVLGSWWSNVKEFVQDTCEWVLKLFDDPEEGMELIQEKVGKWWTKVGGWVAGACAWVLPLFGMPEETAENIAKDIETWFGGVKTALGNVLQLLYHLISGESAAVIAGDIIGVFKGACKIVESILNVAWKLVSPLLSDAVSAVTGLWNSVKTVVKDALKVAWDFVSPYVMPIVYAVLDVWSAVKGFVSDILNFVWNLLPEPLQDMVKTVTDTIADVIKAIGGYLTIPFRLIFDGFTKDPPGAKEAQEEYKKHVVETGEIFYGDTDFGDLLDLLGGGGGGSGGGGGGNSGSKVENNLYTRGSALPTDYTTQSNGMLTAMMQAFATVKDDVVAATQEGVVNGLSGVTITGHITTGDVKLNENTVIGALWPKLDLKLGWANSMHGRG